jgi:hypothetical protein
MHLLRLDSEVTAIAEWCRTPEEGTSPTTDCWGSRTVLPETTAPTGTDIGEIVTGDITSSADLNVGEISHPTGLDPERIVGPASPSANRGEKAASSTSFASLLRTPIDRRGGWDCASSMGLSALERGKTAGEACPRPRQQTRSSQFADPGELDTLPSGLAKHSG